MKTGNFKYVTASLLTLGLVTSAGSSWAGSFSREARGTAAATFLKLPVSARSAGLGGAVTALGGEAASLSWNPAGLATLTKRQALFNHSPYLDDTSYSNGFYAQSVKGGGISVGLTYFDFGSIQQTESMAGNVVGSFHPVDWAGSLGYGHRWGEWSLGFAAKYVVTRVVESDETVAADFGILSPGFWADRVHVGAVAKNVGGELKLADTPRPLPLEYSLGLAARPFSPWLLTGDLKFPRDNDPTVAIGTEGTWSPQEGWSVSVRAGWSGEENNGLGDLSGTTVGFGVGYWTIVIDYAFSPVNDLGDIHRVSLGYSF